MELPELIKEAQESLLVSSRSATLYMQMRDALLDDVNTLMSAHPQISSLIGGNAMSMMHNNHSNHIDFMATVFQFNSFEMLAKTIPWVYRSYRAHGFSFDYFPLELEAWKKAAAKHLDSVAAVEIIAVYDWMLKNHNTMIELSTLISAEEDAYPDLKDERERFRSFLLMADFQNCMKIAENILKRKEGQELLYLGLIQPVMYEIGRLWEQDKIGVAEEHLATSLAGRILANLYAQLSIAPSSRGKAVVTSAPNEFHELGARMLADLLEAAGWDIIFLGANNPAEDLIKLLRKTNPRFLAISLTMPFSIDKVASIISMMKDTPDLSHIKIMVGGPAFNADKNLWRRIGADAWAKDPQSAIRQAMTW